MAKKKIQNYTFYPGIGLNDAVYPNAKWLLNANKTFIQYKKGSLPYFYIR